MLARASHPEVNTTWGPASILRISTLGEGGRGEFIPLVFTLVPMARRG